MRFENKITSLDSWHWYHTIEKAVILAWKYMQENWDRIEDIYGEHDAHLIGFVEV